MARYLMLMCLFQLPLLLFLAINIATELSQNILNGLDMKSTTLSPIMKLLSHTTCDVASKQVEVAVNVCFALFQETAPSVSMKMYPDVDFQELTQLAKSESG